MDVAFWDSSALIPLCVRQLSTPKAHQLGARYRKAVWWGTPVEAKGAFARMLRTGALTPNEVVQAHVRLDWLRRDWQEIEPGDALRDRAELVVERFGLKAPDAFQLAAGWFWCHGHPRDRAFIAGDIQLLGAASQLGFDVIEC